MRKHPKSNGPEPLPRMPRSALWPCLQRSKDRSLCMLFHTREVNLKRDLKVSESECDLRDNSSNRSMACFLIIMFFIVATISTMSLADASEFYPDLIKREVHSCEESIKFSENHDPLQRWITRNLPGQCGPDISVIMAMNAYRKLSVWRVSNPTRDCIELYSMPEPHILGGIFLPNPSWFANIVVHWGLSIRVCLAYGEDTCLVTAQVIAVKDGARPNKVSFRLVMEEVPYTEKKSRVCFPKNGKKNRASNTYLTNWISNARSAGAVGIKRSKNLLRDADKWSYTNPEFDRLCKANQLIAYTPDMVSFLENRFQECHCIGKVCIVGREITNSEFRNGCRDVNSYWRILPSGGVHLYSYSPKWKMFFVLNATFSASFPQYVSLPTVYKMAELSSCFENWLSLHDQSPVVGRMTRWALIKACSPDLSPDFIAVYSSSQAWPPMASVSKTIEDFSPGDTCPVEKLNSNDKCSSDRILTSEQIIELKDVLRHFSKAEEVERFAKKQSGSVDPKRVIWQYFKTLFFFGIAVIGFGGWCEVWDNAVDCYKMLTNASEPHEPHEIWAKIMTVGGGLLYLVIIWSEFWESVHSLKSGPDIGPASTYQIQKKNIAFLVTTTSTVTVEPHWTLAHLYLFISAVIIPLSGFTDFLGQMNRRMGMGRL